MKKLILVFCSSFFLLMIIWLAIGYHEYGDEIINKHLDLYTMITRLDNLEVDIFDFIDNFEEFANSLYDISDKFTWKDLCSILLRPVLFILDTLRSLYLVVYNVLMFVFKPVFY